MAKVMKLDEVKKERVVPQIRKANPGWQLEEHAINRWQAVVGNNVELEDLTNPYLWALVAPELRTYNRISVIREGAWWAECLVVGVSAMNVAQVIVLQHVKLPSVEAASAARLPDGYRIERDAATQKWFALRIADNARMNGDGSNTHEQALRALLDHQAVSGPGAATYYPA